IAREIVERRLDMRGVLSRDRVAVCEHRNDTRLPVARQLRRRGHGGGGYSEKRYEHGTASTEVHVGQIIDRQALPQVAHQWPQPFTAADEPDVVEAGAPLAEQCVEARMALHLVHR